MILKCLLSGIGKYRYGKSRSEPVSGYYNRLILIKIPYFSSDPPHGYYSTYPTGRTVEDGAAGVAGAELRVPAGVLLTGRRGGQLLQAAHHHLVDHLHPPTYTTHC